jgi:hypothetical protein
MNFREKLRAKTLTIFYTFLHSILIYFYLNYYFRLGIF